MAKPLFKITKTQFNQEYNITEVLTDITSIMNKLKTFNSKNQAVAFGIRKQPRDTTPSWFKNYETKMDNVLKDLREEIQKINTRLDNIVKLNNLKE